MWEGALARECSGYQHDETQGSLQHLSSTCRTNDKSPSHNGAIPEPCTSAESHLWEGALARECSGYQHDETKGCLQHPSSTCRTNYKSPSHNGAIPEPCTSADSHLWEGALAREYSGYQHDETKGCLQHPSSTCRTNDKSPSHKGFHRAARPPHMAEGPRITLSPLPESGLERDAFYVRLPWRVTLAHKWR
ncbi:hypothetical protein BDK62_101558 [Halomonas alkaliantarctica]|nr:hypothetical protein BDK62_101558 [Halomonas alkaliantarctica]